MYAVIQYQGTWEANYFDAEVGEYDGWYGLFDALYHADDAEGNLYGEHCDLILAAAVNGGGVIKSQVVGDIIVTVQESDDFSAFMKEN